MRIEGCVLKNSLKNMMERFFGGREKNDKKAIKQDLEASGVDRLEEWQVASDFENNQTGNRDETPERRSPDDFLESNVEPLPEDESMPVEQAAEAEPEKKKELVELLEAFKYHNIRDAIKIIESNVLSKEELRSDEVIDAIAEATLSRISYDGTFDKALAMLENFWLPKEKKIEIGSKAISSILHYNDEGLNYKKYSSYSSPIENIQKLQKFFSVPEDNIDGAASKEIVTALARGDKDKIVTLIRAFPSVKQLIDYESKEVAQAVEDGLLVLVGKGDTRSIYNLNNSIDLYYKNKNVFSSPKVIDAAYGRLLKNFSEGYIEGGREMKNCIPIPKEKLKSAETVEAAYQGLIKQLQHRARRSTDTVWFLKSLKKVKSFCVIPEEKIQSPKVLDLALAEFTSHVEDWSQEGMAGLQEYFHFPEEKLSTPKMIDAAYRGILGALEKHSFSSAIAVKKFIPAVEAKLDTPAIQKAAAAVLNYFNGLEEKYINLSIEMLKNFPFLEKKMSAAATDAFLKKMRSGDFKTAELINKNFSIAKEKLQSSEIKELVEEKITESLSYGSYDRALELALDFGWPQEKIDDLAKQALLRCIVNGWYGEQNESEDPIHYYDPYFDDENENEYDRNDSHTDNEDGEVEENEDNEDDDDDDDYYHHQDSEQMQTPESDSFNSVEGLLKKFPSLQDFMNSAEMKNKIQDLFITSAASSTVQALEKLQKGFVIEPETIQAAFENTPNDSRNFPKLLYLNDLLEKPLDPLLSKTLSIFGDFATIKNYQTIKSLHEGRSSEELELFGVSQTGPAGLVQLEQGFVKYREDILKPDFDPHILKKSEMAQSYFKTFVRFSKSEFSGEGHSFEEMLDRYIEMHDEGEYDVFPLNENYTPSETIYISTIDSSTKSVEYSEQFLSRFKTISQDVQKAKQLSSLQFPISRIVKTLDEKVAKIAEEMAQKIADIPTEKGRQGLGERVASLRGLKLRNLKDFEANFMALAGIKELEPDLRQAMFVMGFAKNRSHLRKDLHKINTEKPELEDVTWLMNFVDHIVNKEVMSQYFKDKKSRNKFRELVNVRSFEEELSRFQNREKIGTTAMKFVPNRGILMEFSGHIADACWADQYKYTLPASFPNFTAITMVQNPGTKHERLCGSCMVIETREVKKNGDPVLLIRGLNPIQNVANSFSMDDFYTKFTAYADELAKKTGRKLAIVIDNHSGGAVTNRPMLFNYLSRLKLEKIRVPNRETEFNGYDVTRDSYLV